MRHVACVVIVFYCEIEGTAGCEKGGPLTKLHVIGVTKEKELDTVKWLLIVHKVDLKIFSKSFFFFFFTRLFFFFFPPL